MLPFQVKPLFNAPPTQSSMMHIVAWLFSYSHIESLALSLSLVNFHSDICICYNYIKLIFDCGIFSGCVCVTDGLGVV